MMRYDDYQFDTQAECCEVYFGHVLDNNCVNYTTPILELYFADYATGRCFQDCDPALEHYRKLWPKITHHSYPWVTMNL